MALFGEVRLDAAHQFRSGQELPTATSLPNGGKVLGPLPGLPEVGEIAS